LGGGAGGGSAARGERAQTPAPPPTCPPWRAERLREGLTSLQSRCARTACGGFGRSVSGIRPRLRVRCSVTGACHTIAPQQRDQRRRSPASSYGFPALAPSARAAAAIFSMTCSLFFSLFFAVSMRQADIASKAAFTALRASSESAGAHVGLKLRGVTSAYLFCMAVSPVTDCKNPLGEPRRPRHPGVLLKVSQCPLYRMAM